MQPTDMGSGGPDQLVIVDDLPILSSTLKDGNVNDLLHAQGLDRPFDNVKRHFAVDDE